MDPFELKLDRLSRHALFVLSRRVRSVLQSLSGSEMERLTRRLEAYREQAKFERLMIEQRRERFLNNSNRYKQGKPHSRAKPFR